MSLIHLKWSVMNFIPFWASINLQWRIQDFPEEGAPTYDFAKFFQKLHEIERIWVTGGRARPSHPPLDPPLICVKSLRWIFWDTYPELLVYIMNLWTVIILRKNDEHIVDFLFFSCKRLCTMPLEIRSCAGYVMTYWLPPRGRFNVLT